MKLVNEAFKIRSVIETSVIRLVIEPCEIN